MSEETKNVSSIGSIEKNLILPNQNEKNLVSLSTLTISLENNVSLETNMSPEKITTPIKSKNTTPDKNMSPKIKNTPTKVNIPTEITTSKESSILTKTTTIEMEISEESNATLDKKSLPIEDDFCDCGNEDCPGCFFPCESCQSYKCGHQCRIGREWKRYDSWVYQGLAETDDSLEMTVDECKEKNNID